MRARAQNRSGNIIILYGREKPERWQGSEAGYGGKGGGWERKRVKDENQSIFLKSFSAVAKRNSWSPT